MKDKLSMGDKIFIAMNIVFNVCLVIAALRLTDFSTRKPSEISGCIRIIGFIFLLLTYIIYMLIKKIICRIKKNTKDKKESE